MQLGRLSFDGASMFMFTDPDTVGRDRYTLTQQRTAVAVRVLLYTLYCRFFSQNPCWSYTTQLPVRRTVGNSLDNIFHTSISSDEKCCLPPRHVDAYTAAYRAVSRGYYHTL